MNYLRAFLVIIILSFFSLFSWMCNQNEPITNNSNIQSDDPCGSVEDDYLTYKIQEYVKVTPVSTPPYYEYRTILDITCCDCFDSDCDCGGNSFYCFHCEYFTTPLFSRYEHDNLVETQNYKLSFTGNWGITYNGCVGLFLRRESPQTFYYHEDDSYPLNSPGSLSFDTTLYTIPENTYMRAQFGRDICP